jgi:CBS domain-containing protein
MEPVISVEAILQNKGRQVWSVPPDATVFDAIREMATHNVGALLVMEGDRLVGIVSERDYTRKIALAGKNSRLTPVREILTPVLHQATPQTTVSECMALMSSKRVRHLPVLENDRVVGVVSIGDLVNWIIRAQKSEIDQLQAYIAGGYPS